MAYPLSLYYYEGLEKDSQTLTIPATMIFAVWISSGGLIQDSVLLFKSVADVSVALETITVLVVLVMNTAVVIKSPSVSGPDDGLLLPYCTVKGIEPSRQFKNSTVTAPVCTTVQVNMAFCSGQTGPVMTSNVTVFILNAYSKNTVHR